MPTVIVPFAGARGKTRLGASESLRRDVSLAMLGDVLEACVAVGETRVATPDADGADLAVEAGARPVRDPGSGQGAAVLAALAGVEPGPVLVVNADLPCVVPDDLRALLAAAAPDGIALVEASDGTTNALSLPEAAAFAPLYGAGSAARFEEHAAELGLAVVTVSIPNLLDDVDTLDDLRRLQDRCGPRTRACISRQRDEVTA
jgi:2-phospho-L-lactate/phosphoenolpyruvate guanylyltransferase